MLTEVSLVWSHAQQQFIFGGFCSWRLTFIFIPMNPYTFMNWRQPLCSVSNHKPALCLMKRSYRSKWTFSSSDKVGKKISIINVIQLVDINVLSVFFFYHVFGNSFLNAACEWLKLKSKRYSHLRINTICHINVALAGKSNKTQNKAPTGLREYISAVYGNGWKAQWCCFRRPS